MAAHVSDRVFALDFDGVVCDSARETALSAWLTGRHIWPRWGRSEPSEALIQAFRRVRPVLHTGYEAVVLLRLLDRGVPEEKILSDHVRFREWLLEEEQLDRNTLLRMFGEARDNWIKEDFEGWLNTHAFFDGIPLALQEAVSRFPVFILTTKQERFVTLLLASQGVHLADEAVFGLESGKSKSDVLQELMRRPAYRNAVFHFVEDRLPALEKIPPQVAGELRMYLAGWGYNTKEQRVRGECLSNVALLRTESQLAALLRGKSAEPE